MGFPTAGGVFNNLASYSPYSEYYPAPTTLTAAARTFTKSPSSKLKGAKKKVLIGTTQNSS
jgi:hypothetical protein